MVSEFSQLGAVGLPTTAARSNPNKSNASSADARLDAAVLTPSQRIISIVALSESDDTVQQPANLEQLSSAIERINDRLRDNDQTLSFALDDESGRMVIRLTDTATNELIRQIPTEEALKFAQHIDEYTDRLIGLVLQQKA